MKLGACISAAVAAIWVNKMRSLLTTLGIIIGVAAVLAMVAIGDGAKAIILQEADRFGGASMFSIIYSSSIRKGDRWVRNRSNEHFEYEDVLAIEAECPSVKLVVPQDPRWGGVLVQAEGGTEKRTGYNGVDFQFPVGMDWKVGQGRFFSEDEFNQREKVCVLGAEAADELFGEKNPIGMEIKVARGTGYRGPGRGKRERSMERFTVVGVMTERGRSLRFGFSWDDIVMMPLTTVQERLTGNDHIREFKIKAKSVNLIGEAKEEVKAVMRKRHRNRDDFFRIWVLQESIKELDKISRIIKITLGSIASFSLLVGGIGIMNMMLGPSLIGWVYWGI